MFPEGYIKKLKCYGNRNQQLFCYQIISRGREWGRKPGKPGFFRMPPVEKPVQNVNNFFSWIEENPDYVTSDASGRYPEHDELHVFRLHKIFYRTVCRTRKQLTKASERVRITGLLRTRAGLAQPVERLIRNHEVGGSSPPSSSTKRRRNQTLTMLF